MKEMKWGNFTTDLKMESLELTFMIECRCFMIHYIEKWIVLIKKKCKSHEILLLCVMELLKKSCL